MSVPAAPMPAVPVGPVPQAPIAAPITAPATPEAVVAGLPMPSVVTESTAPAATEPTSPIALTKPNPAAKAAVWPCPRCAASVPITDDECAACGAGFLSNAATATSTKLPIVGDMGRMSQGQRLMVGAGISVLLMAVFVLVLEIGGHIVG